MGKNRPKRDVGENQGRLGYTQGGLFFPCLNFIFLVHCFVSAKQYQAVCLKVRVNGSEMDHNVFLSSIHMLDPLIVIREVSTQIEDDFVLVYDHMPQTEYKEYVKQMLVKFEIENGRRLQPIRSVGLQTHLLSRGPDGSDHFTTDNVEYFFSPRMPILNCFGEEHNSPKSIWDPQWFKAHHGVDNETMDLLFVHFQETGLHGLLRRFDYPYVTLKNGTGYWEDVNVVLGFMYLNSAHAFQHHLRFQGCLLLIGSPGTGKTSAMVNACGAVGNIKLVLTAGTTLPFVRCIRSATTLVTVLDDNSSVKKEEDLLVESSQSFTQGTKSGGLKNCLNSCALSTNREQVRSNRSINGRALIMLKNSFASVKTDNASVDVREMVNHNEHLYSGQQPLQFVIRLSSRWIDQDTFLEAFETATQVLYTISPQFDLRFLTPYAGTIMQAKVIDELARGEEQLALAENREHENYPGKRWLREGGLDGYLSWCKTWLSDIQDLTQKVDSSEVDVLCNNVQKYNKFVSSIKSLPDFEIESWIRKVDMRGETMLLMRQSKMRELLDDVDWKGFRKLVLEEYSGVLDVSKIVQKVKQRFFGLPISCIPTTLVQGLLSNLPPLINPGSVLNLHMTVEESNDEEEDHVGAGDLQPVDVEVGVLAPPVKTPDSKNPDSNLPVVEMNEAEADEAEAVDRGEKITASFDIGKAIVTNIVSEALSSLLKNTPKDDDDGYSTQKPSGDSLFASRHSSPTAPILGPGNEETVIVNNQGQTLKVGMPVWARAKSSDPFWPALIEADEGSWNKKNRTRTLIHVRFFQGLQEWIPLSNKSNSSNIFQYDEKEKTMNEFDIPKKSFTVKKALRLRYAEATSNINDAITESM